MKRCRHGGETLERARRLRARGEFAAALDDYLAVLAEHEPETTFCRRPILMETARLAYALGCFHLARACACAALTESVLSRGSAPALLLMAVVDAWQGRPEQARRQLDDARRGARWSPALRRQVRLTAAVIGAYAGDGVPALRGRRGAFARLVCAEALRSRDQEQDAAEEYGRARAEFERLRPVRRLRRKGRPVARRHADALAELGWATAVSGQGPSAPEAPLAAATLAARGATERAMRLAPDLPALDRRNTGLYWYSDGSLVKRWSDLVDGDPGRSWLTPEDAETLVSRLLDVFGRMRATDPTQFTPGDRITVRTLAAYGDRIGYPRLALEASRAELRIARSEAGTDATLDWEEMAWVLRRQAICLRNAGEDHDRIPALVEAAELYRDNDTTEAGRDTVQRLGDDITAIHLAAGDWASAIAATVATQRRLAAMASGDPLPAVAAALEMLHARSLTNAPASVAHDIDTERTEVLRILAGRDPARFASAYGEQLLTSMHSRCSAPGPAREALTLSHGLGDAVLRTRICREIAHRVLHEQPETALSIMDEVIAEGPLPREGAADEAENHRLRAESLRLLGRRDERADALLREARTKLGYAGSAFPHQRFLTIEDALWDAGRTEAARSLIDKAIDIIAEDRDAAGSLRIRRAERASELLRDTDALDDLAIVAERYPRLAARCQAAYALAHWRAQRRDEAVAACDRSLELDDRQHRARHLRGAFRARLGSIHAALEDLEAAARIGPDYWTTRAELSEAYLLLHLTDEAVREGHLAVDLDPDEGDAHAAYGLALLAAGHRQEAYAELDAAVTPRSALHSLDLPRLLVARGDVEAAVRATHEAVAAAPAPYLVRDTATQLRQLAATLPETSGGCARVLEALATAAD
ncbi:hypothetical protein ABZ388_28060 [Micromonospora parva]|uniref:hypothetical protein n=1 Tax=Micromonospora parva TaxID=1464048 RepID=UPI0033D2126D